MNKTDERRRAERLLLDAEVEIRHADHTVYGTARDISLSGLFVYNEEAFPIDSLCEIEIIMKTGVQELRIKGNTQIVRFEEDAETGRQGIGLRIIEEGA